MWLEATVHITGAKHTAAAAGQVMTSGLGTVTDALASGASVLENAQPCPHPLGPAGPPPPASQSHRTDHSCGRSRPGHGAESHGSPEVSGTGTWGGKQPGKGGALMAVQLKGSRSRGRPLGVRFWPSREVAGRVPLPAPRMPRSSGRGLTAGLSWPDDHGALSGASTRGPCPERCLSPRATQGPPDPKTHLRW